MKITAPHSAMGKLARVLYDAGVNAALIERTGTGWVVELLAPPGGDLGAAIERAGGKVLLAPIDTATGRQSGSEVHL